MPSNAMKILRVMRGLPIGGLERRTLDLLEHLNRSDEFDCRIVTIKERGELFETTFERGIHVSYISIPTRSNWRGLGALRRHIVSEKFDVVHTQSFYPNHPGRVAAIMARAPVIIAQHHNLFSKKMRRKKHLFYEKQLARFTNSIVCVSEAVRDDLIATTGIAASKMRVIHNGIDLNHYGKGIDESALRSELGLGMGPVVALVGRFVTAKDPLTYVKAAAVVLHERPDAEFLLVGDGQKDYRAKIERAVEKSGIGGHFHLTGFRRDVPKIMTLCDLGVLTSKYEGLPGVVLEFFASGRPMVVTDVPGPREIVRDGVNALVARFGDANEIAEAILKLLNDDEKKNNMGKAARKRAEDFTLDAMVEKYANLYREFQKNR